MGDGVEWQVRPAAIVPHGQVQPWEIVKPDGSIIECVTGSIAIELGKKLAQEGRGLLEVYASDGRLWATEDFRLN